MDNTLTGIILAGGKSLRMGTDKALIEINGQSMIKKAYLLLKDLCDEIILSTTGSYFFKGIKKVSDEKPGLGPIGGIYSCLKQSGTDKNLVLAVDIPFVNQDILKFLIENIDNSDVIFPLNELGKIEPLCAIYSKSILPAIEKMIQQGDFKVQNLKQYINVKTIQISRDQKFFDEKLFLNLNTPADLKKLSE